MCRIKLVCLIWQKSEQEETFGKFHPDSALKTYEDLPLYAFFMENKLAVAISVFVLDLFSLIMCFLVKELGL